MSLCDVGGEIDQLFPEELIIDVLLKLWFFQDSWVLLDEAGDWGRNVNLAIQDLILAVKHVLNQLVMDLEDERLTDHVLNELTLMEDEAGLEIVILSLDRRNDLEEVIENFDVVLDLWEEDKDILADENFGALILVFDSDLINVLVEGNVLLEGLIVDVFEVELDKKDGPGFLPSELCDLDMVIFHRATQKSFFPGDSFEK